MDQELQDETNFLEELLDNSEADVRKVDATKPGTITYEQHEGDTPVKVTLTIKVEAAPASARDDNHAED